MARSNDRCCSRASPRLRNALAYDGVFTNRAVEIGDRAIGVAPLEKDDSAIVQGMRVVRIQPNRLVVVVHGAVELVERAKGVSTIVEGVGRLGVQPNRFIVISDRAFDVSHAPVRDAPVDESAVIVRIQEYD